MVYRLECEEKEVGGDRIGAIPGKTSARYSHVGDEKS